MRKEREARERGEKVQSEEGKREERGDKQGESHF